MTKNHHLLAALVLIFAPSCDDEDSGDGHGDHGTGEHADAELEWVEGPPATAAVGTPIEAVFAVHTEGDIHVTELRACMGQAVADCGLGGEESFDLTMPAAADGANYRGSLTFDTAGVWTVVAYAHVGPDPFTSAHAEVTVE